MYLLSGNSHYEDGGCLRIGWPLNMSCPALTDGCSPLSVKEFKMKHLKTKVLLAEVQTHLGNTNNVVLVY